MDAMEAFRMRESADFDERVAGWEEAVAWWEARLEVFEHPAARQLCEESLERAKEALANAERMRDRWKEQVDG